MKVLSLFDGMACGAISLTQMGAPIERYVAYEIDKYAIQAATHNFPFIEERGDVFKADFTEFAGFDAVIGGSPCTYWSIAQKNNRETEASGLGWELFSQYVRAVNEAKPKWFLYENNKSMSKEIKASITESFGFEPILINSALLSAQNRQRLYWVGVRQPDGTYRKADIEQPEDRGILLRDVLDGAYPYRQTETEKGYCLDANYWKTPGSPETFLIGGHARANRTMVAEPLSTATGEKAFCIDASYYKGANPAYSLEKHKRQLVAEPVCVAQCGRYSDNEIIQHYEPREDGKTNAITTVQKDNAVCEPVCMRYERTDEAKRCRKAYEAGEVKHGFHELSEMHPREDGKTNTLSTVLKDNPICEPVRIGTIENNLQNPDHDSKQYRVYSPDGKSTTICGQGGGVGAKTGLYAVPCGESLAEEYYQGGLDGNLIGMIENPSVCRNGKQPSQQYRVYTCDGKSVCVDGDGRKHYIMPSDGKTQPIYEVRNGLITIKDKQYPIKLADGYYIIRKLTVSECKRLQTVPDWYDFSVISNSQAYKCLGNGWTCEVIMWLMQHAIAETARLAA